MYSMNNFTEILLLRLMKPFTDPNGEVRELTGEDFARLNAAEKVLPAELLAVLPENKRRGRPPSLLPKKTINIRLSQDVLAAFKAGGPSWQTRIDNALRQ
jgi:uncharacterized protein (DUF4415 family)